MKTLSPLQKRLHVIIYEAETPAGRVFDIALLVFILSSVAVVMLESVESIGGPYRDVFRTVEWIFTAFFTVEYLLRLYCIGRPIKYATSFFGIIDLLAIMPAYLGLFISSGAQYFMMIRAMRLLRVFRIFKLANYTHQGNIIVSSLKRSRDKIFVFLFFVVLSVMVVGSVMYVVEGDSNPAFANIPTSIYWAVVTVTTVGYGDISPTTPLGQFFAAFLMVVGYVVIAVPTGIVSAELMRKDNHNTRTCTVCASEGHDDDAVHCKFCGGFLD